MRERWPLAVAAAALTVTMTGCISFGGPRSDVPAVDACTIVSIADVRTVTGIDVAPPGDHISSPLSGGNAQSCEWGSSGPTGGLVSVSLQSIRDFEHASYLHEDVLDDGTAVKTDTHVVDTQVAGQPPMTAIGVWYRDPGNDNVVRCEVHRDGTATYDADAAGALARRVAQALK